MTPPAAQGYVPVADGRLYYERAGAGPAIVLIHSAFLDSREWDPQFVTYATHWTVVRYDVRGAGRSTSDKVSFAPAEDLEALLNHLGISRSFVLGNSDGARIACEFAAGLPDRVAGLVLVAGTPGDIDPTPEEQARFMDTVEPEQRLVRSIQSGNKAEAIELILDIWAPRVPPAERGRLRAITSDNYEHFSEFLSREQPPGVRPSYPVRATLRRAAIPVLSLAGAHDNPALNMLMGRFAQEVPTAAHHVLADGDHTPSLSAPAEFDQRVLYFLSRVDGGLAWPPASP